MLLPAFWVYWTFDWIQVQGSDKIKKKLFDRKITQSRSGVKRSIVIYKFFFWWRICDVVGFWLQRLWVLCLGTQHQTLSELTKNSKCTRVLLCQQATTWFHKSIQNVFSDHRITSIHVHPNSLNPLKTYSAEDSVLPCLQRKCEQYAKLSADNNTIIVTNVFKSIFLVQIENLSEINVFQ